MSGVLGFGKIFVSYVTCSFYYIFLFERVIFRITKCDEFCRKCCVCRFRLFFRFFAQVWLFFACSAVSRQYDMPSPTALH